MLPEVSWFLLLGWNTENYYKICWWALGSYWCITLSELMWPKCVSSWSYWLTSLFPRIQSRASGILDVLLHPAPHHTSELTDVLIRVWERSSGDHQSSHQERALTLWERMQTHEGRTQRSHLRSCLKFTEAGSLWDLIFSLWFSYTKKSPIYFYNK